MNCRASKISHPPSQLWLHHQDEETLLEPGENTRPARGSSGLLGSSIGRCWNASCIPRHVTLNVLFSFALKAKCSDTRVKCHVTLVLVGPMKPKGRLWDGGANAWPASFSGERCALCLRCVIDSTAVVMIYPLRISCYASVANKQAMTFILLASSPLVCSGNTFEFSQRASFSVSLFFCFFFSQSCKNTISVFNHGYSRKDTKRLPSKMRNVFNSREQKMPAGKRRSRALWGYEGCESFWSCWLPQTRRSLNKIAVLFFSLFYSWNIAG